MFRILLVLLFVLFVPTKTLAAKYALVIGNDNYKSVPRLAKARNDARTISEFLKDTGFNVVKLEDATYREMVKAIDAFSRKLGPDDQAVFFFAGHGVQLQNGNYLLPVDVDSENEAMVQMTSYNLDDITYLTGRHKSGFQLIIIDACRDNPFPTKTRSFGNTRGLVPVEPVKGQMVMYSASRGQQALDRLGPSDKNKNSVFTRNLVKELKIPGQSALDVIRNVQDDVEEMALSVKHEQRPSVYNESRGDFYFLGPPKFKKDEFSREDAYWEEAKDIGNLIALEGYVKSYPNGRYISLARAKISQIKSTSTLNSNKEKSELKSELKFWDKVKSDDTEKGYREYLKRYPTGFFASVAEDFLDLFDQQLMIETMEKYASDEEIVQIQNDRKVLELRKNRIDGESNARVKLANRLARIDVPTF